MTDSKATTRKLVCPFCGYTRYVDGDFPVYCGPHVANFGGANYPAVQMREQPRLPGERLSDKGTEK